MMAGRFLTLARLSNSNRQLLLKPLIQQQQILRLQTVKAASQSTLSHQDHRHDKLWAAERYLSLGLLAILPAAGIIHNPIMDYAAALSLVVHVHWGVEAIVVDYIRPSIFGPTIPKISIALVYALSSLALGGLFMFNYTDVGISNAVRMIAKM